MIVTLWMAALQWPCIADLRAEAAGSQVGDAAVYSDIVRSYARGEMAAALQRLATWDDSRQSDAARRALESIRNRRSDTFDRPSGESPATLLTLEDLDAAGALHMELALGQAREAHAHEDARIAKQIAIAQELLAYFAREKRIDDPARRWNMAIALALMGQGQFGVALGVMDRACRAFPGDGPLHLTRGTIHETLAMSPADLAPSRRTPPPPSSKWEPRSPQLSTATELAAGAKSVRNAYLAKALADYRRASELMPGLTEARLRRAHVEILRGEDRSAAEQLTKLLADIGTSDARIGYLAQLFLARVHGRHERFDAAEGALRAALRFVPSGQSAQIDLIGTALRRGRGTEAGSLTDAMFTPAAAVNDPWWSYRFGQFWLIESVVEQLRHEVRG
jgi:Flp pilus assembly protein TadD